MKFGLKNEDLHNIVRNIAELNKVQQAILFGSRAKGNYEPGSDIDIALKGDGINLNDILDLTTRVDALDLPYKFDFVIYNRVNESLLKDHINRVGIEIYRSNQTVI